MDENMFNKVSNKQGGGHDIKHQMINKSHIQIIGNNTNKLPVLIVANQNQKEIK